MRAPVDGAVKGKRRTAKNQRRSDAALQLITPRFYGFALDGGPNLEALATYIRLAADGNKVLNMVADWLDPRTERKPWGRKLVLTRAPGARKRNDDMSFECFQVVDAVRELAATERSHKRIIDRVAKRFVISESRVRQHLATYEEARQLVRAKLRARGRILPDDLPPFEEAKVRRPLSPARNVAAFSPTRNRR
jgi:hypothetical protein